MLLIDRMGYGQNRLDWQSLFNEIYLTTYYPIIKWKGRQPTLGHIVLLSDHSNCQNIIRKLLSYI